MKQEATFQYSYSAKENEELQKIREKYLPKKEGKFEELKRLDKKVQSAGMTEGIFIGTGGALIFGLGMCFAMQVLGSGAAVIALGVVLGLVGAAVMAAAYPVSCKLYKKAKTLYAPRILELTEELSA